MNIHSLFVLKKNGVCVYSRNFTEEFENIDVNLITPFFSAIFSFSENLISRNLEELEMSDLRFTFKVDEEYIFTILADASVSLLFVSSCLNTIAEIFYEEIKHIAYEDLFRELENPELDHKIDDVITAKEELGQEVYQKIIDMFENLIFENEILGAALLSTKGSIVYSSLPHSILLSSLKELEIRFMTGALNLPELFYSLETGQKVFSKLIMDQDKNIGFLMVLLFDKNVSLGMADVLLHKIGNRITKRIL